MRDQPEPTNPFEGDQTREIMAEQEAKEQAESAVVVAPIAVELVLWGTRERRAQVTHMLEVADMVKEVIEERHLYHAFDQKKYVKYEGWSLVGSMLGIQMNVLRQECIERAENGSPVTWEVEVALTKDGSRIGHARAMCSRRESQWAKKPDNQLAQMAATRAMGAAYRRALGFIPQMAGFEPGDPPDEIIDSYEVDPNTGEVLPTPDELAAERRAREQGRQAALGGR